MFACLVSVKVAKVVLGGGGVEVVVVVCMWGWGGGGFGGFGGFGGVVVCCVTRGKGRIFAMTIRQTPVALLLFSCGSLISLLLYEWHY